MARYQGVHYRKRPRKRKPWKAVVVCVVAVVVIAGTGLLVAHPFAGGDAGQEENVAAVSQDQTTDQVETPAEADSSEKSADAASSTGSTAGTDSSSGTDSQEQEASANDASETREQRIAAARAKLDLTKDFRKVFYHGNKPAKYQKYIVLHDTEGDSAPESVVSWWAGNGNLVAAHFVVGKDGSIVQCAPLGKICHHAGYGDKGHDKEFGVKEDGRDDMKGAKPVGSNLPDYGMNAWSIGIEMVHVGGEGGYPKKQLQAVDNLIAYLDAYYDGNAGKIIDHKMWRTGNSDTSKEFAKYLKSYRARRTHV